MKTKNLILMLLTIVTLNSCNDVTDYQKKPTIYSNGEMSDLKVYVIDSCEYIGKLRGYNTDVITHKGNCKFCKIRSNK